MKNRIVYRVKRVERFIITRYESTEYGGAHIDERGEFGNHKLAMSTAYLLARAEEGILEYTYGTAGVSPQHPR